MLFAYGTEDLYSNAIVLLLVGIPLVLRFCSADGFFGDKNSIDTTQAQFVEKVMEPTIEELMDQGIHMRV